MKYLKFALLVLLGIACQPKENKQQTPAEINNQEKAMALAQKLIITDGHVDLPYRLKADDFEISEDKEILLSTEDGDFDYNRAKEGGLDAPFMSIYIPARYQQTGGAKELADTLINMVESIATAYPDKFALARSPQDVEQNFKNGKISLPMGMENGAPIEENLDNVKYFHERGIRYITLTHSKDNQICDSSYDTTRTWNGLSPFGEEVVAEMNNVGIMIDVSHISDSTFYQVMELTKAPVIASHSSCRHFTPDFERNMGDEMIKKLGENDGVIQINFGSTFLDINSQKAREHVREYYRENNLYSDDSAARAYREEYYKDHPFFSNVVKVADHIDRVVELAGIDHVGLGSDFDGVGDSLPLGLKDVSMYPNLIEELLDRGYSEEDIAKICYKNVFRVWNKVGEIAQSNQNM